MTEADKPEAAREAQLKIGIINVTEFARVLELMRTEHAEHLAAAVIAGFCGLRRVEVHTQLWADINLERGFLRVSSAKQNTPAKRLVPLSHGAISWLMLCKRSGELASPHWGVDLVRKFAREEGITIPGNGFRHSYISHSVAAGSNVRDGAACWE